MKRKGKRRRRSLRLKDLTLYRVKQRFARLKDHPHLDRELRDMDLISSLKFEYPPRVEGGLYKTNFLEAALSELISSKIDTLREKSETHGLSSDGTRSELLRRLYLHYRSTFSLSCSRGNNDTIPAYGPDYEMDHEPKCVWGRLWLNNETKRRRELRAMKRFPRRLAVQRFPRMIRFLRAIRFPRLIPSHFRPIVDLVRDPVLHRKLLK